MSNHFETSYVNTIVIGGGQSGLSVGYHLAKRKIPFAILDANQRVGDAWRNRWDSLRMFTPARYGGLPGMAFPAVPGNFATKDSMADYLETYAKHFNLPVRTGVRVDRLFRENGRFVVTAAGRRMQAENVVVAMANYQVPKIPPFAKELHPGIVQLHSHNYRNLWQLQDGATLVVGVGNSGADISLEVARTHTTFLSGKESGVVPWPIETAMGQIMFRGIRFLGHHVLTLSTPVGRKLRPKLLGSAAPLIRVKPDDLAKAGIERVARVVGVRNGWPLLEDGRTLEVANIIWCTGYQAGFSWIDLPIFGEDGRPLHERGVVSKMPGMYFVGLHFLYAMSSASVIGVGRDSKYVVKALASRPNVREREKALQTASVAA
jgi:putative flavoprotein involved in K+ transport